jgi:DNA-binding NtrC family response regulator
LPEAIALLAAYDWPGNVRELSNVIERAVILSSGDALTPIDLPAELATAARSPSAEDARAVRAPAPNELATDEACNLEVATVRFQRGHVASVLERVAGNRDAAGRLLGLSPATFYRYLQKLGLKGYQSEMEHRRV